MTTKEDTSNFLVLTFLKDFSGRGSDRLFIYDHTNDQFSEKSLSELLGFKNLIVTHDYWLIAPSIYKLSQNLPCSILDIREFSRAICGKRPSENPVDRESIVDGISTTEDDKKIIKQYENIFYKTSEFNIEVYKSASIIIAKKFNIELKVAQSNNELDRYTNIELPVFNMLWPSICRGIKIDNEKLRSYKKQIDHDYFFAIKKWGIDFNVPFEVPNNDFLIDYLASRGFDFSDASLEYILEYIPTPDHLGERVMELRKLERSRRILNDISANRSRINSIADIFGTRTSRIIYRNPAIQNLAKRYRDIFIPDGNRVLWYVDFSQFETAIMTILSNDLVLLSLYNSGDLYKQAALLIFNDMNRRKNAKQLFLSYAYGMKIKNLADASKNLGGDRRAASDFFRRFSTFEQWKNELYSQFESAEKIGTSLGNFFIKSTKGKITQKEKRSVVSQVIQGTASLIFKKTLLNLRCDPDFELLIPMHDAVFFQYPKGKSVDSIKRTFESTFSTHFDNKLAITATVKNTFT